MTVSKWGRRRNEKVTHHCCKTDKLDDDKSTDCEEDSTSLAKTVVEELCHGLVDRACEDGGRITHTEAKHNIEQETRKICEQHSKRDSPRSLDLWFRDLFCDMCCGIVIGHGPRDGQETKQETETNGAPT